MDSLADSVRHCGMFILWLDGVGLDECHDSSHEYDLRGRRLHTAPHSRIYLYSDAHTGRVLVDRPWSDHNGVRVCNPARYRIVQCYGRRVREGDDLFVDDRRWRLTRRDSDIIFAHSGVAKYESIRSNECCGMERCFTERIECLAR